MQLAYDCHESPAADHVNRCIEWHHIESTVVNCVELSRLVRVTDICEQSPDRRSRLRLSEVRLLNSYFCVRRREEDVDRLRLIAVVLEIGNRFLLFAWDVSANSWATELAITVDLASYNVPCSDSCALAQVGVRLELSIARLSMDALSCVPLSCHVPGGSIGVILWQRVEALAQVLDTAELVLCCSSEVLNLLLDNYGLWEGLLDALLMHGFSHAVLQAVLAVAKRVCHWVHVPSVVALFLHTGRDVHMSLLILCCVVGSLLV